VISIRVRTLAVIVTMSLAAACGSTVQTAGSVSGGGGELGGAVSTGDASNGLGATSADPSAAGGGVAGGARAGTTASAARNTVTTIRGADGLVMGRGVTSREVKVGIFIAKNLQAATGAVTGTSGAADEKPYIEALVDYVNKTGGLRGRKIVPTYGFFDPLSSTPYVQQEQEACAHFTEDEKVFVILAGTQSGTDGAFSCASKSQTPLITQIFWPLDDKYIADAGSWLYAPSRMRVERWMPFFVDGLKEQGYFSAGAKVGLVRFSDPVYARTAATMKRELARVGVKLVDEFDVGSVRQGADLGSIQPKVANAILRFRAAGIDHVVFGDWSSVLPTFFIPEAESQSYRPRYGLSSQDAMDTIATLAPEAQIANAVGVSWMPPADADDASDPRDDPANNLCKKIIKDASLSYDRLYAGSLCDNFFFLRATLDRATALTPAAFEPAARLLGTSFDSPFAFGTAFGPGRFDGANVVRNMKWGPDCQCFVYVGAPKTVP
jgi:hypothetical protein